jgi:ABC-2 type transport system permease protein
MSAFLRASALIASAHFTRLVLSRRAVFCALLALLPAGVTFTVASLSKRSGPAWLATHMGFLLELQIIVPLIALFVGSAVIAEEVEDRTITYLFTRPIPRPALLVGRFVSTLAVLTTLLALGSWLVVLAAANATGKGPPISDGETYPLIAAAVIGGAVYAALFAALGAFVRHPMIVGLGYAFAIEGFLANLPGKNQALTVQYHLRSFIAATGSEAWHRVEGFRSASFESGTKALIVLAVILVSALLLGAWRLARREFVLTA